MTHIFYTAHSDETKKMAKQLAHFLKPQDVMGLSGELGAGKTTFVQGLAEGLESLISVSSPTFTLINEYPGKYNALYHMDFYRMNSPLEAETLGLEDYFNSRGITVIEWFERCSALMPKDFLEIQFAYEAMHARKITFIAHGERSKALFNEFLINADKRSKGGSHDPRKEMCGEGV